MALQHPVLMTGGSSGVGEATARQLLANGHASHVGLRGWQTKAPNSIMASLCRPGSAGFRRSLANEWSTFRLTDEFTS